MKKKSIGIKNLVKTCEQLADEMWENLDKFLIYSETCLNFQKQIAQHTEIVEEICKQDNCSPTSLTKPSRHAYCWLKFLLTKDYFSYHLKALNTIKFFLYEKIKLENPIKTRLIYNQALWRWRKYDEEIVFTCNEGFINAPQEVWEAIIKNAFARQTKKRRHLVQEFVETESFAHITFELESFAIDQNLAKGKIYDLDKSFERVNRTYFQETMEKPRLTWNNIITVCKFGHYRQSHDVVMISMSLDNKNVPEFVVDFIMYHELLHKKHGAIVVDGRRRIHTPQFKKEERFFKQYLEAENFLTVWAKKLREIK